MNYIHFLEKALTNLPSSHSFAPVRQHIANAIYEINKIEAKKQKKAIQPTIKEKWEEKININISSQISNKINKNNFKDALAEIERKIEEENKKINKGKDEDLGNILG